MPGTLQDKLLQYEITPPPGMWNKISSTLDEEFVSTDGVIASKLDAAEIAAPVGIFSRIENELYPSLPGQISEPKKVFSLAYRRIAIAAALIGLIAIGVLYFNKEQKPAPAIVSNTPQPTSPQPKKEQPAPANNNPVVADNVAAQRISGNNKSNTPFKTISRRRVDNHVTEVEPEVLDEEPTTYPEQAPLYELSTVSALQPVSVSAPPLRDKKGNMILDFATVSNANEDYITVTGPNGKQTKISSKFFSCLGYMNSSAASSEIDERGLRCKSQFEEWRNRLLSEPGFIPTANNFFDIIELKDMLQEM